MSIFERHEHDMITQPFIFHLDKISNATNAKTYTNDKHKSIKLLSGYSHWHNNIEILYFKEGSGYVYCDNEQFTANPGDIFVINSNQEHAFSSDSSVSYYCLIPDTDFCTTNGINSGSIRFSTQIHDNALCDMLDKFIEIFYSSDVYRDAMLRTHLLFTLIYIAKNHSVQNESADTTTNVKKGVYFAVGYIKSHLGEKITIDELAESVNISKYHFIRNFKKITGDTPITFINKLRCETAKKLLTVGSYPINEVCEKCGFENMSYFAKVFKKHTGLTPSEFSEKTAIK